MRRQIALGLAFAVLGTLFAPAVNAQTEQTPAAIPARHVEPVVLEGVQLPGWSGPQAEGTGNPASGHNTVPGLQEVRDAHNGRLVAPPEGPIGVPVEDIVAYRYDEAEGYIEIPVQVDERFPYFLANSRSDFAHYSGTDKELTYAWDVESWKKMFGDCFARYANDIDEVQAAIDAGWVQPASTTALADFLATKTDPVPTLDHDDEVVFMADDAGAKAPGGVGPPGTGDLRQEIALADPRDPGNVRFVYLFTKEGGSSFDESNGYVDYVRDENADEWIDRDTFPDGDPENLSSSNAGYGPNIPGTVCTEDKRAPIDPTPRNTGDRFPRDGVTVSTDAYQWRATGRWMIREMHVTKPGAAREYGPDLIDRWKGRAFQQSPDSSISLVGFEDEQINWEANAALLGELAGPVRAIREVWGADSGTNVTKTETFYRDAIHYRYRVRVHPIPPDGLYTSWDYNNEVAHTYYNETRTEGVPIDGVNDEVFGNVDGTPTGQPAFFDAPDPTHTKPLAFFNWEQVSGAGNSGSLVYMFEMGGPTSLSNPLVVPYYRDDRCLDDGTGDDPSPRQFPGEASTDPRVYPEDKRTCTEDSPESVWKARQGCFGCHGVHYFVTHDTDNATTSAGPVDEIDGAQWQWAVPTNEPTNVGDAYANTVKTPLVATARLQSGAAPEPDTSVSTNVGCDPIDKAACLLPFPNDFFTVTDGTTDSGRRVNLSPLAMPRTGTENTDGGEGKPVDPTEWNRNDGFSPGSMVMTLVDGLDLHQTWGTSDRPHSGTGDAEPVINQPGYFDHRDHIADIRLFTREDAPLVILNAATGERHPFWSELDSHPDAVDAGERLLLMRPARNFDEGTRYIVALRNLRKEDGSLITARPGFAAYRSGGGEDATRQAHFDTNIFPVLEDAEIARDDLYLAWDFTVASERNLAERMLHMRNDAFGILGDTVLDDRLVQGDPPDFIVDSTEDRSDGWTDSHGVAHTQAIRRVRGRVDVPNYMDRIQQTEGHVQPSGTDPVLGVYYDIPAPGSRLLDTDLDGLPDQNPVEPTVRVPFVCDVPLNGQENIPGFYGHGLLGDRDQINDFNKSPRGNGPFMGCAVDWWGMSTADIPTVATILADFSNFPSLPDRAQQGFLNFMIAGRAAVHPQGFANDPAFQQDGKSLIKTADADDTYLVYDGNSQGGIMGGALVAVSPDISRGILGVLGMNYSTLLNRSVDWEGELELEPDLPPYSVPFYTSYQDPAERQILFHLMQMLWDRGEANGYAHHMTTDPYANTPPHEVMLQAAYSDHQVANASAEVEARTIGAPLMSPDLGPGRHWALDPYIETATYPHDGSALVYWDSGNATPPNGNVPPTHSDDPHGHPRDERAASWQEAHFLLTGEMYDVCNGGFYLTRRDRNNPASAFCLEPNFAAGTDPADPTPTPTDSATPTPDPTDSATPTPDPTDSATPTPDPTDSATPTPDPTQSDRDGDGVPDDTDNCPDTPNPNQTNTYGDARGDACEPDPGGGGGGGGGGGQTASPSASASASPSAQPANSPAQETGDIATTISATDAVVGFGKSFTVSGTVDAPRDCSRVTQVELARRVYGQTDLEQVAILDVANDGTWTYTGIADVNASYVATARPAGLCTGSSSTPVDVLVKVKITAKVPDRCSGKITGRVLPAKKATKIILRRKSHGAWKKVSSDRLNGRSRFALDATRCGRYRIVWPKQGVENLGARKAVRLRG